MVGSVLRPVSPMRATRYQEERGRQTLYFLSLTELQIGPLPTAQLGVLRHNSHELAAWTDHSSGAWGRQQFQKCAMSKAPLTVRI